uniref:Methyltransferase domain-containing protein n=1 Tax=Ciona intestinalis TaxID=7719 RepID=F6ZA91_CIOIN
QSLASTSKLYIAFQKSPKSVKPVSAQDSLCEIIKVLNTGSDYLEKKKDEKEVPLPGKCNLPAVSIPETFNESAKAFLKMQNKSVNEVAINLLNYLSSRRTQIKRSEKKKNFKSPSGNKFTSLQEKLEVIEMLENQEDFQIKGLKTQELQDIVWKRVLYNHENTAAFLLARSAGCYASAFRVLSNLKNDVEDFNPKSILDVGSGTGTNMWAANSLWKDSLKQYVCVDVSDQMNKLSHYIVTAGDLNAPPPSGVFIRRFLPVSFKSVYDIVIASYTLSELPTSKERLTLLKLLWEKTSQYLVLIEYGNFNGFQIIMEARNLLLRGMEGNNDDKPWKSWQKDASVVIPCPHSKPCPVWAKKDTCTFSQTYNVPGFAKALNKKQTIKEQFTFVVFEKNSNSNMNKLPRIIRGPFTQKTCVNCFVCNKDGALENIQIHKNVHGAGLKTIVKKCKQGDYFPL